MKRSLFLIGMLCLSSTYTFAQVRIEIFPTKGKLNVVASKSYYCFMVNILKTDSTGTEIAQAAGYSYVKKNEANRDNLFFKKISAVKNGHCRNMLYKGEVFETLKESNSCLGETFAGNEKLYLEYKLKRNVAIEQLHKS